MSRAELLTKIESIVVKMVKSIMDSSGPSLLLRPRRNQWKDCYFDKRLTSKEGDDAPVVEIKYSTHKKRFEIICNLLEKIYRLLLTKASVTKRELYYENTELFGSQLAVNAAILDICSLLGANPWEFQVLSTSKGLVAGAITITTAHKEVLDCSKGGVLVPQDVKGIRKIQSSAAFIIVVEKDAAFQKLLDDGIHSKYGPCIIITGKGEPDMNTRLLLHRLCMELKIPVLIVVDADPYGIEIMCTYRYGSLALSEHVEHLAVVESRWIGIHPSDVNTFSIPTVPMSDRDMAKAKELVNRPYVQQNEQLLEQVNCMIESGKKCEIENLTALSPRFLTDMFLFYKITYREVI